MLCIEPDGISIRNGKVLFIVFIFTTILIACVFDDVDILFGILCSLGYFLVEVMSRLDFLMNNISPVCILMSFEYAGLF